MKILAADDLDAVQSLVGVNVRGARELNVELVGSRRVDLLAQTTGGLVHVEFVKDDAPDLDLRMVEYWARIRRRHRAGPLRQYVLVLGDDVRVPERCIDEGREVLAWSVVRVADLDPGPLLAGPTTAAVAALARGSQAQRVEVLVAAAGLIGRTDLNRVRTLLDAAATLTSIVLPRPIIDTALKEAAMPILIRDTPLGRELVEEGRQEGRQEGEREAVLRLTRLTLRQRFGDDPRIDAVARELAELPDEERLTRIATASGLDELRG